MCAGIFNTVSEVFSRLLDPESPLLLGRLTTPPTIRERLTRPLPGVRGYSKRSAALSSYSLHNVISGNRASARPIWPSFRPCVYHGRTTEQHQGAAHAVVNAACAAKYDGWSHESGETICRELGGRRKRLPTHSISSGCDGLADGGCYEPIFRTSLRRMKRCKASLGEGRKSKRS